MSAWRRWFRRARLRWFLMSHGIEPARTDAEMRMQGIELQFTLLTEGLARFAAAVDSARPSLQSLTVSLSTMAERVGFEPTEA